MTQALPLVHNIETPGRRPLPETFQAYRANFDMQKWRASGELYYAVDREHQTEYLNKWDRCREFAWFARHKMTGEVRVFSSACRLRWCSLCADARRGFVTHTVAEWLTTAKYPKFLTLTLKHSDAPLAQQVKNLYDYFRKFRKAKFVKDAIGGGIWFFQIKRSKKSGQWHPHIHCVVDGKYMKQKTLSELWCKITFGSKVVDIRPIRNIEKGAAEVARYASTPADLKTTDPSDYVELFDSLHGKRSCGTWGTAKSVSLRQPKADDVMQWINIGSWTVMYASQGREAAALMIIKAWEENHPLADGVTMAIDRRALVDDNIDRILERPAPYLPGFYDSG